MKKLFWPVLILSSVAAAAYFAYPVIRDRYFPARPETENKREGKVIFDSGSDSDQMNGGQPSPNDAPVEKMPGAEPRITDADCENSCEAYADPTDFKYCRSFCGQTDPNATTDDCASKSGIDRDACWKDEAILEKKFDLCDKISDQKLKESCRNRLTEDILEQVQGQ